MKKNLKLTRADNGAGLGDAIMQINFVYKLCLKHNATYIHSPIESMSHNSKYDELLGLDKYKNRIENLEKISININDFLTMVESNSFDDKKVYAIKYDYTNANSYSQEFYFNEYKHFPWLDYCSYFNEEYSDHVLVHLRFGDSFCYPLSSNYYFDARNKKICSEENLINRYMWSLGDLENILEILKNKNKKVLLISDGISSGYRTLDWNNWGEGFPRDYIREVMEDTWRNAKNIASKYQYVLDESDLKNDLSKIMSAAIIIATEGSFARNINSYFRNNPAPLFDMKNEKNKLNDLI